MSESNTPAPGTIGWIDLTVEDADGVRDFYRDVTGWSVTEVEMGGYSDYCMDTPEGDSVVGICHARGTNEGLPAQWLVYIVVEDVEKSAAIAVERGGEVLREPRTSGGGTFCIIRDPAGAVAALYSPPSAS